jgi:hypothetical protein
MRGLFSFELSFPAFRFSYFIGGIAIPLQYGCATHFALRNTVPTAQNEVQSYPVQKLFIPSVTDSSSLSGLSGPLTKNIRTNLLLTQKFELAALREAAFSVQVDTKKLDFSTTRVLECVQKSDTIASKSESCATPSGSASPTVSAEAFVGTSSASVRVVHLDTGVTILQKNYDDVNSSEIDVVAPADKQQDLVATKAIHSLRFAENQSLAINSLASNLASTISSDVQVSIRTFLNSQQYRSSLTYGN